MNIKQAHKKIKKILGITKDNTDTDFKFPKEVYEEKLRMDKIRRSIKLL